MTSQSDALDDELGAIADAVEAEWGYGGLGRGTLYGDFAVEVAKRALRRSPPSSETLAVADARKQIVIEVDTQQEFGELEEMWAVVRTLAEGSDWRRDEGEHLTEWLQRAWWRHIDELKSATLPPASAQEQSVVNDTQRVQSSDDTDAKIAAVFDPTRHHCILPQSALSETAQPPASEEGEFLNWWRAAGLGNTCLLGVAERIWNAAIRSNGGTAKVPDGWKLVREFPTAEQQIAGEKAAGGTLATGFIVGIYRAMLAAAPEKP